MSKTYVPLALLTDSPYQARLDDGDVEGLAETILEHGLRQLPEARLLVDGEQPSSFSQHTEPQDFPAPVRSAYAVPERDSYEVQQASGHRRAHAVQLLNDDETIPDARLEEVGLPPGWVPVDLQRLTDEQMLDLGTIENVQREGLSPVEEAHQIADHAEMGRTNDEIGQIFGGRSASWVSNRKGLLKLPQKVQMAVHEGRLSTRQAQALRAAYELQEQHPEAMEESMHDPDGLFESAKRGTKQSGDIRREVKRWEKEITREDYKDLITEAAELAVEMTDDSLTLYAAKGAARKRVDKDEYRDYWTAEELAESIAEPYQKENGGQDDFSPDVGTTHPDARGPARETTDQTTENDEHRDAQESTRETDEGDGAGTGEASDTGPESTDRPNDADRQRDGSEREGEAGKDGRERAAVSADPVEASGDGAPATARKSHVDYAPLDKLIGDIESHGWLWETGRQTDGDYHATVWVYEDDERVGSFSSTNGDDPGAALLEAFDAARDSLKDPIGTVDTSDVDRLLSAGEDMWDEDAAEEASIASLLVAHRVAGARRETWRTREIADVVERRVGTVTEDDVPDEVMADVRAEVEQRLETAAA